MRTPASQSPATLVGQTVLEIRHALGWSQRELGRRSGVSQSTVCAVERNHAPDLTFGTAAKLLESMGARLRVHVDAPFLAARPRQRDAAHARMSAHVTRRLERLGWQIHSEVEIGGDRSRGWIDVLAFHVASGLLLVIELKSEIHDLGAIDRTLGWYEREAWAAARRIGWRPHRVNGCLLLLATAANDAAARANRDYLGRIAPVRARALTDLLADPFAGGPAGRGLAMIDPRSHSRTWLRATAIDGRRSPAPYIDYADFMRSTLATPRPADRAG